MASALLAFLKALPDLVSVIRSLGNEISKLRDRSTERKIAEWNKEVNETIALIKNEDDRNELLKLVKRLNNYSRD